jgi:hypothetical protein
MTGKTPRGVEFWQDKGWFWMDIWKSSVFADANEVRYLSKFELGL